MDKNKLEKLLLFLAEIAELPENEWFKSKLLLRLSSGSKELGNSSLDEIYELCIKKILKSQAFNFYQDFKIPTIKDQLILDYERMERFRRDDNFEDFSLALFQQIEGIVNKLVSNELKNDFKSNHMIVSHRVKNSITGKYDNEKRLWQLIFKDDLSPVELRKKLDFENNELDFLDRYKLVLYYYFFYKKIYTHQNFQDVFFLGYDLYQSRNLNHRGGKVSIKQQGTVDKVIKSKDRYYFKFLGFLEEFIFKVNNNLGKT